MSDRLRVLITGSQGFIGTALSRSLRAAGYDVWGADMAPSSDGHVITADLLDREATVEAVEAASPFGVLIHAAALTHTKLTLSGKSCLTFNTKVTENVLRAIEELAPRVIFLSSVSVYGEYGRYCGLGWWLVGVGVGAGIGWGDGDVAGPGGVLCGPLVVTVAMVVSGQAGPRAPGEDVADVLPAFLARRAVWVAVEVEVWHSESASERISE